MRVQREFNTNGSQGVPKSPTLVAYGPPPLPIVVLLVVVVLLLLLLLRLLLIIILIVRIFLRVLR